MIEFDMKNELDSCIETSTNLKWNPWIGNDYFNLPHDNRLLIIGESHYCGGETPGKIEESIKKHENRNFTRLVIEEIAIKRDYGNTRLFQNFHKALFLNDSFDSNFFWNQVTFYNFIQRPMNTNKERPSKSDFNNSWKEYLKLIKILKPKYTLFLGNSAASSFNQSMKENGINSTNIKCLDKIGSTYSRVSSINDSEIDTKIIFIRHPSSYFSPAKWNKFLNSQMNDYLDWITMNNLNK